MKETTPNSAGGRPRPAGPRLVVALDEFKAGMHFGPDCLLLLDGELWEWEPVGCVVCVDEMADDHVSVTFKSVADGRFRCLWHNALVEVPYVMRKDYRITIGSVVREGFETVEDSMLFPASLSASKRHKLIEQYLDAAEAEEGDELAGSDGDDEQGSL